MSEYTEQRCVGRLQFQASPGLIIYAHNHIDPRVHYHCHFNTDNSVEAMTTICNITNVDSYGIIRRTILSRDYAVYHERINHVLKTMYRT